MISGAKVPAILYVIFGVLLLITVIGCMIVNNIRAGEEKTINYKGELQRLKNKRLSWLLYFSTL